MESFCSNLADINELMLYTKIYELLESNEKRPLTPQFDVSEVTKTTFKCNTGSFGPVCQH